MTKRVVGAALAALLVAGCARDIGITAPEQAPKAGSTVLAIGSDPVTGATIETNKDDYVPGEVVHVVGRGWAPGETVTLAMTEEPNTHEDISMDVVADSVGEFSVHYYDVQVHDVGVEFTLTATGAVSGSVAVATFTDGTISAASVTMKDGATCTSSVASVAAGTPICADADFTIAGSGATEVQIRWRNPSGTVVHIDTRSSPFPNGTAGSQSFSATYTPTVAGTWTVLLCQSSNTDPAPGGTGQCASSSQKASQTFDVTSASIGTATSVLASPTPSVFGQSVTFTATVTPASGPAATGTVKFYEFGAGQSCSALSGATELASDATAPFEYTTSSLSVTSHTITACYTADAGWTSSDGFVAHTVNKADVSVAVSDNPTSSNVGDNVDFTITVAASSPGAGTPTGTVYLYDGGTCNADGTSTGGTLLGSDALSGGSATISTSALGAGTHTVVACYPGDTNFNDGAGSDSHAVSLKATVTTIVSSDNPSVTGQTVTFTATVKHNGTAIGANGNVEFKIGGTDCSDATSFAGPHALDANGQAQTTQAFVASGGSKIVRACYGGNSTYAASEGDVTQNVNKAETGVSASDTPDPSVFGESVTFGATVSASSPGAGTPTGDVEFWKLSSGDCSAPVGTLLDTGTLSSGSTSIGYSALAVGTHTITACYQGDADFNGSGSTTSHTVNKAQSTLSLATNGPTTFGGNAVFTATIGVQSPGSGTPSGDVYFYDGGDCTTTGSLLGPGTISSGSAQLTISTLDAGTYTIVACYGGDDSFLGSGDDESHTVDRAPTTVTVSVLPTTQQYSDSVVFTATITPYSINSESPTGSVQFAVNGVDVGSPVSVTCAAGSCTATLRYKVVAAGGSTLTVTADFTSSNGNFADDSDATGDEVAVTMEDATVYNAQSSPSQILVGGAGTVTFNVRETNPEKNSPLTLVGPGDITNATVSISAQGVLYPSNSITFGSCTITPSAGSGYSQTLSVSCPFNAVNTADTYDVSITVTGNYYTGAGATLIQVTDPSLGFATGGGWYWHNGVVGGEKVNFGFMAKSTVNNRKTVYQGALLVIRHMPNGDVVKVKSNVFDGYSIKAGTTTTCPSVTFSGKANYSVNGSSLGNAAFTGYGLDCGEPGTSDKFGLYHAYGPSNEVATSSTLSGLVGSAKTLAGGNVQVPQPSKK